MGGRGQPPIRLHHRGKPGALSPGWARELGSRVTAEGLLGRGWGAFILGTSGSRPDLPPRAQRQRCRGVSAPQTPRLPSGPPPPLLQDVPLPQPRPTALLLSRSALLPAGDCEPFPLPNAARSPPASARRQVPRRPPRQWDRPSRLQSPPQGHLYRERGREGHLPPRPLRSGQLRPLDCKCVSSSVPPPGEQLPAAGVRPRLPAGAQRRPPRRGTACRTSGSLGTKPQSNL